MLEFKTKSSSFKESKINTNDVVLDGIRNENAMFLFEELISFLKSIGCKPARIKIVDENIVTKQITLTIIISEVEF